MRVISPIVLIGLAILVTHDSKSYFINNQDKQQKNFTTEILDQHLINIPIDISVNTLNTINTLDKSLYSKQDLNNIFQFLLAEIAISREQPLIAKNNLIELFKNTKSPNIAEILTEFAIKTDDFKLTSFAAKEWAESDPNNWQAQLIATIILLEQEPILVEKFIERAIKINPSKIDLQIVSLLSQLNENQQQLLEQRLKSIVDRDPKHSIKQLCLAQTAIQLHNIQIAEQAIKIALQNTPDLTNAILLQAKLIKYNTNSDQLALNYLLKQINEFPKNEELIIFYANALFDNEKNSEALKVLSSVIYSKNLDNFLEANLLTAEIYMQKLTLDLKKAENHLNKLMNNNLLANGKVYFMLGQIAELQLETEKAIKFYTLIEEPPYQVIGFLRAALLLADNQQYSLALDLLKQADANTLLEKKQLLLLQVEFAIELQDLTQAMDAINQGLKIIPNDIDFLYAASVIYSLNKQFSLAEKNLKTIIKIQPENHIALNALGFILTINQTRQQEAFNYLQLALKLSPDNPIYMDNLGMLLYRMGKIPDSLKTLTNAYNLSEDLNIAIHLGELLWISGKHQQATSVWKKAWQDNPNDLELINVLNQYKVFFIKNN